MHGGPGRLEAHTWRRLTQQRHQDVAALHRQQKAEKVLQQQGADRAAEWLPPPFQEGVRDDAPPAVCHLGEDFGQLVVNASGFKYAPDFPGAPNRRDQVQYPARLLGRCACSVTWGRGNAGLGIEVAISSCPPAEMGLVGQGAGRLGGAVY